MFPLDSDVNTKAVILKRKGSSSQAFEIGDIELPPLKQDEILIKNQAFGLNYADVMARNGLYRDAPPMPFVDSVDTDNMLLPKAIRPLKSMIFLVKRYWLFAHKPLPPIT